MFEALFILTTIDTGTRIARFLLQEIGGKVWPQFGKQDWLPGTLVSSLLAVAGWGYLIWTGNIDTIWPMFGIANQLLAVVALSMVGTVMVNSGEARYLWVVVVPMAFVTTTTMTAGVQLIQRFWCRSPAGTFKGYLNVFSDRGDDVDGGDHPVRIHPQVAGPCRSEHRRRARRSGLISRSSENTKARTPVWRMGLCFRNGRGQRLLVCVAVGFRVSFCTRQVVISPT